jgi:hypothetical protein
MSGSRLHRGLCVVPTSSQEWPLNFSMAMAVDTTNVENFLPVVVVLLKNIANSLVNVDDVLMVGEDDADGPPPASRATRVHESLLNMNTILTSVLHDFCLAHARCILDEELGF